MSNKAQATLLLAGGGTGGHLYPALAVAQALASASSAWRIAFVGTARGLESRVLPPLGFKLHLLPVLPLRGKTAAETARGIFALPKAGYLAHALVGRLAPTLTLGVGGYAAGPAVLAAWAQRRTTWLMEANASAGLTNRLLAKVVDRILLGTPNPKLMHSPRAWSVGYPVRQSLKNLGERPYVIPDTFDAKRPLRLLVMGGSQGARALNRVMPDVINKLRADGVPVQVVHQAGVKDLEASRVHYRDKGVDDGHVVGYIDAMDEALEQADLIFCRAGASTLAELGVVGRPALLVPYPFAADDHQTANAQQWADASAAELIAESALDATDIAGRIAKLTRTPGELRARARAAKALGRPGALDDIVRAIIALLPEASAHV